MDEPKIMHTLSRRDFLKTLSGLAAAFAVNPLPLFSTSEATRTIADLPSLPRPLKLGVILPYSTLYPDLGQSLTDGLKLYFEQAGGAPVTMIIEKIATSDLTVPGACHLLSESQADLLVGVCNPNVACQLSKWAQDRNTFFLVASAGANIIRQHESSANIFHTSLGYWQSNAAMGAWAAKNLGTHAFIASSFYESGYDALYAFRLGLEMAGAQVAKTFVAHVPPEPDDLPDLIAAIRRAQPDFVYGLFSGSRAVDFVRAYAESGLSHQIPLAASAFMVDETLLSSMGDAARGIRSGFSWSPSLQTPENVSFAAAFKRRTGRTADAFAGLGYNMARFISQALNAVNGDLAQTDQLRCALRSARFAALQGCFEMNPTTHTSTTPLYLREVQSERGMFFNQIIGELAPIPEEEERLVSLRRAIRTGWTHAYLEV